MKKLVLLFTIAFTGLIACAQQNDEPYMTKSLSGSNIKNILAKTSGGSLQVSGDHASDARIEVYIRSNNGSDKISKEEIEKRLENYELNIDASNGKLTAIARSKTNFTNWRKGLSISFKIYVPQQVSTDLSTSGGSIHLASLTGTQQFRTSGGSLHMDQLNGKIDGRTSGGSIHISNSHDDIDLHTSGGSIEAKSCDGKINLATSGGSVRLNELKGKITASTSGGSVRGDDVAGELYAHTSGGRVDLQGLRGSVDASTSGGSIDVELLELGSYVTIRNSGGSVDLTLPKGKGLDLNIKGDRVRTTTLTNFSGKLDEDEIDGTVNGGGIPVKVRSSSGRITLTMK